MIFTEERIQLINGKPTEKERRIRVADFVREALEDGSFTETDILTGPEPLRSFALEWIDGMMVQGESGGMRASQGPNIQLIAPEPLLLVHRNPPGTKRRILHKPADGSEAHMMDVADDEIFWTEIVELPVPGTEKRLRSYKRVVVGNFALVPNGYPVRRARNLLHRDGFPMREVRNEGKMTGTIVEWRWLHREATGPAPGYGIREMYEEILARPGFAEVAGITPSSTKAKGTRQAGAEAR